MTGTTKMTKNVTFTKGNTYTLDPVGDLGLPKSGNFPRVSNQYDGNYSYPKGTYLLSTTTDISVVPEMHQTYTENSTPQGYYTYQLTPHYLGNYTFFQKVTLDRINTWDYYEITYNITVVDVTAISMVSTLSMLVGAEQQLSPTIIQAGATTTLTWLSSNTSVATVSNNGTITAIKQGSTTITCAAHNGVSATCEVTVNPVLVSGITLNKTETELVAGEKLQLTATIVPDNATDKGVTWSSSNSAVAVVNESGQVTAVGSGICNITATAKDGSGTASSCLVTVLGNVMFCEDFGAVPGAVITLPVQLTNDNAIQGFEFKLVLPDGLSVQTDGNGKLMATLTERASTQGLEGSNQGNGVYQFVFTSTTRLQGNSGAVVNVPLVVDNNMAIGQYNVVVKNVELVRYGTSSQIHHGDRSAALTVKPMTLGDVNGDGRVSVADAIAIINYVLGRTPVSFIAIAADVNGDNDISLADAVATVDIILAGGGANARAAKVLKIHDPQ